MEEITITVPEERDILEDGMQMLREEIVKHQGIWKINLNDVDKWPSDPHGDRVDLAEKLSLLNGMVYDKSNRSYKYSLSKKAMRFIYAKLQKSKHEQIKLKLVSQKSLIHIYDRE